MKESRAVCTPYQMRPVWGDSHDTDTPTRIGCCLAARADTMVVREDALNDLPAPLHTLSADRKGDGSFLTFSLSAAVSYVFLSVCLSFWLYI